jgi:hypothetical protein
MCNLMHSAAADNGEMVWTPSIVYRGFDDGDDVGVLRGDVTFTCRWRDRSCL